MGNEAIVIPIVIDPKAGVAGLKAVGDQAAKTNTVLNQGSTTGGKFADSMKNIGKNALAAIGAMNLAATAGKVLGEELVKAFKEMQGLASATEMLADAQRKAEQSTKQEVVNLQLLYATAKDTTLSYGQRQVAIEKLNKQYPELHRNITLENIGTRETAAAIRSVIDSLILKAKLQNTISQITELSNSYDDYVRAISEARKNGLPASAISAFEQKAAVVKQRMEELTEAAQKLQGLTIGEKFFGDGLGAKIGEIKTPEVKIKPDKLKILPKLTDIDIRGDISLIGPDEAKREGLEFGQLFYSELNKYFNTAEPIDFSLIKAVNTYDEAKKKAAELIAQNERLAELISSSVSPAFENMFDAIINKEDVMKSFFDSMAQAVQQLIKQLIRAAIQAAVLSAIFPGGIKNAAGGVTKGFGGFFKSIFGFADGGLVTGPVSALIGEGRGTNASNPEVVAPLDRLKTFFADMIMPNRGYNASGMGTSGAILNMPKEVILRASGKDMLGVITLEQLSQGRTG